MKKSMMFFAVLLLMSSTLNAAEVITKEGTLTLTQNKEDNVIRAGKEISFELPLYSGDFLGTPAVFANGDLKNNTDKHLKTMYIVSFYDEGGNFIVATSGGSTRKPQSNIYFGSAIIKGTPETFKKIKSYKFVAYTFEVPPEEL